MGEILSKIKSLFAKKKKEEPVDNNLLIIPAKHPSLYKDYFESLGFDTDIVGKYVVVWKGEVKEKKRKDILKKLKAKLEGVI